MVNNDLEYIRRFSEVIVIVAAVSDECRGWLK